MYKTVRHGENSLQYTILPQTEEVLSNSGLKGKGRDYSPSIHVRRSRRRFSAKNCVMLTCGLLVVTLLAFVTIFLLNQKLLDPWLQSGRRDIMSSVLKYRGVVNARSEASSSKTSKVDTTSTPSTTTYATTTVTGVPTFSTTVERSTAPPWILPALRSWKSSSTIQTIPTEGEILSQKSKSKILTAEDNMSIKPWEKDAIIRPTATPEPITLNSVIKHYTILIGSSGNSVAETTKAFEDVLITTKSTPVSEISTENSKMKDLKDAMLSVDDDDDFKESLEVDEVFSLPPLKPDSGPYNDVDEVTMSKPTLAWYNARWPFVDTSSYFQWDGYSRGDNLLAPLLVGALSSIALVCLLAFAAKRRRRSQSTSAQSGHTTELATDDNTNLLTAENGEDAEE